MVVFLSACGETADEISAGMDHTVPGYTVLNDSLVVSPLQEVQLEIEVTDAAGLKRLVFSYGNWGITEAINIDGAPTKHTFTKTITIPQDAAKEWVESVTENDVNQNVKEIPIYIKVN